MPLDRAQSGQGGALPGRHHLAVLRAAAPRGPGPFHRRRASSAPIGRSPAGTTSWRWTPTTRPSPRPRASACPTSKAMAEQEKARDGRSAAAAAPASSPWTSRSTARTARRSARPWRPPTSAKMAPLVRERAGQILDSPADRQGVRLGRPGVEGADGDDAGHPVRLPVRAAPQAALVVGHVHEPAGPRAGEELAAEGRGDLRVLQRLRGAVEPAGQRRAGHRPDLDAGAQPRHPEHARWTSIRAPSCC